MGFIDDIRSTMNQRNGIETSKPNGDGASLNSIDAKIKAKIEEAKSFLDFPEKDKDKKKKSAPKDKNKDTDKSNGKDKFQAKDQSNDKKAETSNSNYQFPTDTKAQSQPPAPVKEYVKPQSQEKVTLGDSTPVDLKPETKPVTPRDVGAVKVKGPNFPGKQKTNEGLMRAAAAMLGGVGREVGRAVVRKAGAEFGVNTDRVAASVGNIKDRTVAAFRKGREEKKGLVARYATKPMSKRAQQNAQDAEIAARQHTEVEKGIAAMRVKTAAAKVLHSRDWDTSPAGVAAQNRADAYNAEANKKRDVSIAASKKNTTSTKSSGATSTSGTYFKKGTEHMTADAYRAHAGLQPRDSAVKKQKQASMLKGMHEECLNNVLRIWRKN